MSENIGLQINVCKGGLSVNRNIIFNCPSSPTSSSPVSLPTDITNRRTKNFPLLLKQIGFSLQSRAEIQWRVHNLKLNNRWLGAYCQGERTRGPWFEEEKELHINALELKIARFEILVFTQNRKHLNRIQIQMGNILALS